MDPNQELVSYFENLKNDLQREDNKFREVSSIVFTSLDATAETWKVNFIDISSEDMLKLLKHFLTRNQEYPVILFFIKSEKKSNLLWVSLISNLILSASAHVEKMITSNFDKGNLCFHTLEFID